MMVTICSIYISQYVVTLYNLLSIYVNNLQGIKRRKNKLWYNEISPKWGASSNLTMIVPWVQISGSRIYQFLCYPILFDEYKWSTLHCAVWLPTPIFFYFTGLILKWFWGLHIKFYICDLLLGR